MFFIVFYYFTAASGTVPETHKSVNIQITISIVGHLKPAKRKCKDTKKMGIEIFIVYFLLANHDVC